MHGVYDLELVALSVVIAMFAAYAALDLAGRVTAAQKWSRFFWLVGGATAMGLGIWAMHYIGMLAFRMPVNVLYDLPTVLVSLLAAISASAIALYTVSRAQMKGWQTFLGSVSMGGGIAAMHYIGMAAMRVPARTSYYKGLVGASIVLAVVISYVALVLSFKARAELKTTWRKVASALVMGSAIPVMHYTGMWAASFSPSDQPMDLTHTVGISSLGVWAIGAVSLLILAMAIGTSFLDRLVAAQRAVIEIARKKEVYFRGLAEAIPQIVWTARPNGELDFYNQRWYDYTGKTEEETRGWGWQHVLHPEDLAMCMQKWQHALQTGEAYEIQYRFRRASDGSYRWHLGRALPVRDSNGVIIKWFGTCTDINDQKRDQEELEKQVRQRTAALVEANARLTEEMGERERAQHERDLQTEKMVRELTERSKQRTGVGGR